MGEPGLKGTVTSLSSMFPVEEAEKAAKRVEEALEEKRKEKNRLNEFIADNTSLTNLVQKLPDELHHDIMVPFGKAAFFPGRLIHTNEFMVLLGEGYYAERTAKQTVEILKRREKSLESQVNSLKATMEDLKLEASFFDTTALEASEGLVEIREEYVEENSAETESGLVEQDSISFTETDNTKGAFENEEYACILSRLDELEKEEELAAENDREKSEDSFAEVDSKKVEAVDEKWARVMSRLDELEKEELTAQSDEEKDEDQQTDASESKSDEDEQTEVDFGRKNNADHNSRYQTLMHSESTKPPQQRKDKHTTLEGLSNKHQQPDLTNELNCTGLTVEPAPEDGRSISRNMPQKVETLNPSENSSVLPDRKVKFQVEDSSRKEAAVQTKKPGFDSSKAFTGSIVEHAQNLQVLQRQPGTSSQSLGPQPSKPISRFKMQRK
ncbi:hypothetical protein SLEP1_g6749 [Rubroshorea leprosula]|uniref:RNA polymerase II subunit 5-mediating protein homolog n=1 Tax=Rubroshorea leprosula TaxID=152421 RepID=A0AAV5HWJ0_9ROSI|nr:hypothetical protein SLEP1_g6749 [Rubroshorea leprosula]